MPDKIINRIGGGLGNQMFIYALGERLARELGVPQVFDTTDFFVFKYLVPCGVHARKFELYNFKGPRKYSKWWARYLFLLVWIVGKKIGWGVFERLLRLFGMHWRHSDDTFCPVFAEIPKNCRAVYCSGINCAPKLMPDREVLMEEFTLADTLDGEAKNLEGAVRGSESVSIHVRRTDYLIQPTPWDVPFSYYERAIEQIKGAVQNPKWFVFSDDADWCKRQFAPYLNDFTVVEGNAPGVDLYLMSQCRHHIIANSTFSWWGAYLAPDTSGMTLCPEYWGPYVDTLPETFYPAWWKKVECDPPLKSASEGCPNLI